jgi:hypothetical protein
LIRSLALVGSELSDSSSSAMQDEKALAERFVQHLSSLQAPWLLLLDDVARYLGNISPLLLRIFRIKAGRIICSSRYRAADCGLAFSLECALPSQLSAAAAREVFEGHIAFWDFNFAKSLKKVLLFICLFVHFSIYLFIYLFLYLFID